MKLYDYIPLSVLDKAIDDGYVERKDSPCGNFFLLDYTREATFDQVWNDATSKCRGLVVDNTDDIVGMCIPKFHNLSEGAPHHLKKYKECIDSGMKYEVYEKVDGSFGNVWWNKYTDRWQCSTRGSFESDQAKWANEWLNKKLATENLIDVGWNSYNHNGDRANFIFEIIYPDNRVVVDYGDMKELVLLTGYVIGWDEATELNYEEISYACKHNEFVMVSAFDMSIDRVIKKCETLDANHEGYVIKFENGFRVKCKGAAYCNLHRILSGLSTKAVWENIDPVTWELNQEWLKAVPEEFKREIEEYAGLLMLRMDVHYNDVDTAYTKAQRLCSEKFGGQWTKKELVVDILKPNFSKDLFCKVLQAYGGKFDDICRDIHKEHQPEFKKMTTIVDDV